MKKLNVLCIAGAAMAMVGCAKDKNTEQPAGDNNGVLTVSIKSDKATRAVLDGTTNTEALVEAFENNVYGFSAYVFNYTSGDLEASATSVAGKATITGLNTAGAKRVVVIANDAAANYGTDSSIPRFENDPNYSRMETGYLSLEDQAFTDFTDLSKGFLMTGESDAPISLQPGTNTTEITVKRVVAKIELGDITFDDGVELSDLAKFDLTAASIQRAVSVSSLGTGDIITPTTPPAAYYGAIGLDEGSTVSVKGPDALGNTPLDLQPYLIDLYNSKLNMGTYMGDVMGNSKTMLEVSDSFPGTFAEAKQDTGAVIVPYAPKGFWYVLPNADSEKFTLLTLTGSYDGTPFYYPIEINDPDATGSSVTKDYVKRNTIYRVNIHFKNFNGVTNPDLPGVASSLEVTVDVADWEGPVEQTATW